MPQATVTAEFAGSQIHRLLRNLATQMRRILQSPDAEAVHDLRVGIRRFDQALLLFGGLPEKKKIPKARHRLKQIMALAGDVRDCDIADKLIGTRFQGVRKKIDRRRESARRSLARALRRWTEKRCSSKLNDRLQLTGTRRIGKINLPRMTREFMRFGEKAARRSSPAALHRFRIAAKHYRYTLELLAPIVGRRRAAYRLGLMKEIQARLGNVNDCVTVRALAADWKPGKAVIRFLRKRERQQMEIFRNLWNAQFADRQQARRWTADLQRRTAI